jgi:hypothetical protein
MAEHTRKGSQGQPQYQDTAGAWHDSPSGPSDSGSSDSEDTGGGGESSGGAASRSLSAPTGNARTVVGLMGMAVVFSVIGAEINAANGTKSAAGAAFSEPFIIIGGGTIAAVLLTLLSDAGESAQQFAVGLAGLACITALLVNGAPVWRQAHREHREHGTDDRDHALRGHRPERHHWADRGHPGHGRDARNVRRDI